MKWRIPKKYIMCRRILQQDFRILLILIACLICETNSLSTDLESIWSKQWSQLIATLEFYTISFLDLLLTSKS
jgi:hypothetical protein